MNQGKFISFEGGEGSGKTTQCRMLQAYFRERGIDVVLTREPGGTQAADEIRTLLVSGPTDRWDPCAEVLLHFAARREHYIRKIKPALEHGQWVICDRFVDSTVAYQGWGHRLGTELIDKINGMVLEGLSPNLTFVLDVTVDEGLKRASNRDCVNDKEPQDRYERMQISFHERVRQGFLRIAENDPTRCQVVDASQSTQSIHSIIVALVDQRFSL